MSTMRSRAVTTCDCEYGFSRMGCEVSGTWGAAMERGRTHPGSTVYGLPGDGSFMMLPMDIYSGVLTGTDVAPHQWSAGGSFWEVGVPEVSHRPEVGQAREELLEGTSHQRPPWR